MSDNRLQKLHAAGQAIWLDFIDRTILRNGDLARRIRDDALTGMTSNPTIFEKAIGGSEDYDAQLRMLASQGKSRDEIYEWTAFKAEYIVSGSGYLSLPLLGDVPASGLTTMELSRDLGLRLKDRMGLVASPDVTVEVVQFRPFYIVGTVEKPGEYPYRPGLNVLEAFAIAGGRPRGSRFP